MELGGMIRGTTPTLKFNIPIEQADIATLFVTFCQNGTTILEKGLADVSITGKELSVTLTQADTLRFSDGTAVEMQVRLKGNNGEAFASNIMNTTAGRILKDGAI